MKTVSADGDLYEIDESKHAFWLEFTTGKITASAMAPANKMIYAQTVYSIKLKCEHKIRPTY